MTRTTVTLITRDRETEQYRDMKMVIILTSQAVLQRPDKLVKLHVPHRRHDIAACDRLPAGQGHVDRIRDDMMLTALGTT